MADQEKKFAFTKRRLEQLALPAAGRDRDRPGAAGPGSPFSRPYRARPRAGPGPCSVVTVTVARA